MTAEIHDYRAVFDLKRQMAEHHRRRRGEPRVAHYHVLLLRDLTLDELRDRLVGTGLLIGEVHGQDVLHAASTLPGDAA